MRLYVCSFAVHIVSLMISHACMPRCMLTLASRLAYTVTISVATNCPINALVLLYALSLRWPLHCFAFVAVFLERMHETDKLLENVSEEQIAYSYNPWNIRMVKCGNILMLGSPPGCMHDSSKQLYIGFRMAICICIASYMYIHWFPLICILAI